MKTGCNFILPITVFRTIMLYEHEFENKHSGFYKAMKRFYNLKQERHTTNTNYFENIQSIIEVVREKKK